MNEEYGPAGNKYDKDYANCFDARVLAMGDKLETAMWILARSCVGDKTKRQMKDAIEEASELLMEVRKELVGR